MPLAVLKDKTVRFARAVTKEHMVDQVLELCAEWLYAIGDTHLSLSSNKPMDVFGGAGRYGQAAEGLAGGGAGGYGGALRRPVLGHESGGGKEGSCFPGRPAWGMSAQGKPRLLVEHRRKDEPLFFAESGFIPSAFCTTTAMSTGIWPSAAPGAGSMRRTGDQKVFNRELIRLEASLKAAGSGPSCAFSTIRPSTRATGCPEIIACWSSTAWSVAITAISTAAATGWP